MNCLGSLFLDYALEGVVNMPDCPALNTCIFFNDRMESKPNITNMYKRSYCQSDNSKCARWLVSNSIGREFVPTDLYPNMFTQGESIIAKHKEET